MHRDGAGLLNFSYHSSGIWITCMYAFNDRERTDCPKKTILGILLRYIKGKYKYLAS